VNAAPEALDTLKELTDALGNDFNMSATVSQSIGNRYTKAEVNTLLGNKQDTIPDNGLTIAKTANLQTTLNGKQDTITDGSLTIAKTNGLQTALNDKANNNNPIFTGTVTTNNLTTNGNFTINTSATNNVYTKTQVDALVASSSAAQPLSTFATEQAAFYAGVNQGSQYLTAGVVNVVKNRFRPNYTLSSFNNFTHTATSQLATLNGATSWTIEALINPSSTLINTEQYIFDGRSSGNQSSGFAVGLRRDLVSDTRWKLSVYSEGGGPTVAGPAMPASSSSSGPFVNTNTWTHVAWVVNNSLYSNYVFFFINGVPAGSAQVGTNFNTTSVYQTINIGHLNLGSNSFPYWGQLGGLKISSSSSYVSTPIVSFTPPDVLLMDTNTKFLLSTDFIDRVSNTTLTRNGSVTFTNDYATFFFDPSNTALFTKYLNDSAARAGGVPMNTPYVSLYGLAVRTLPDSVLTVPYSSTAFIQSKHAVYTFGSVNSMGSYTSGNYTSWGINPDLLSFSPNQSWKCVVRMKLFTSNSSYWEIWFGQSYASWGSSSQPQGSGPCRIRIGNTNAIFEQAGGFRTGTLPVNCWNNLGSEFYCIMSRLSDGKMRIRLEDLSGNLIAEETTSTAFTYNANTILWGMYCETINAWPGATLNRGMTLEASTMFLVRSKIGFMHSDRLKFSLYI